MYDSRDLEIMANYEFFLTETAFDVCLRRALNIYR
jgi:hypothetical protein